MKNEHAWKPSKYVLRRGVLSASRDVKEVGVASRLIADLVAARYAAALPHYARGKLVDLGCGKVPLYGAYRPHVASVTCVDWGNSFHANAHLDVETSLLERLPFPDGEFDTIILSDVLEHIPEPGLLWDEMARILAPGGHVVMNVPFLYCIHESPHDYYRYTSFALQRFAEMRGMTVSVLEVVGGGLDVLGDTLAKYLSVIPAIGSVLASIVQWSVAVVGRTSTGVTISRESGRSFPLGFFLVARKPETP
ncbi:MAG: class I SAM-dependent methyltransferase [Burkholderiales bacterium]